MLEKSGGGSVTILGCVDVSKEESGGSGGGSGGSSKTGHSSWHSLKNLYASKVGSNMQGGGGTSSVKGSAGSSDSNTPVINTNWWENNNDAPNEIINKLKDKADCVYGKLIRSGVAEHNLITETFVIFGGDAFFGETLIYTQESNLINSKGEVLGGKIEYIW